MKRNTHPYAPVNWPLWLGFGLLRLLVLLPYPIIMTLGKAFGLVLYRLAGRRARIARTNLGLCLPGLGEDEREALVRANFISSGQGLMETVITWWMPDWRLRPLIEVRGLEHLSTVKQEGLILLTAHFSSLELCGRCLGWHQPFHPVYRPHENPVIEHFSRNNRSRHAASPIPRHEIRTMIKRLREAQAIWLAPDQRLDRKGSLMADFFGVPCITSTVTARLAQSGRALVLPLFMYRKEKGQGYVLEFMPPLDDFPSQDAQADTQRINDLIEDWVRRVPSQYNWMHRRFKGGGREGNFLYQ
jgi:KDO2-lipid IV(A) lauroyltransferase